MALNKVVEIVTNPDGLIDSELGVPHGSDIGSPNGFIFGDGNGVNQEGVISSNLNIGDGMGIENELKRIADSSLSLGEILESKSFSSNPNVTVQAPKVTNEINMDTTSLSQANEIIASSLEKQKEYHLKQIEKADKQIEQLDFNKNGMSSLKDSRGNLIIPRESLAKKNAEVSIDITEQNSFCWEDIEEFLEDIIDSSPDRLVGDILLDIFSNDGMGTNVNSNPFSYILNLIKENDIEKINELKDGLNG